MIQDVFKIAVYKNELLLDNDKLKNLSLTCSTSANDTTVKDVKIIKSFAINFIYVLS